MNIVVEKQPNCVAILHAEIPSEEVIARREKILAKIASKARIPGYRPGKAPMVVIAKRYAKDVDDELINDLFAKACDEGTKRENLKVIDASYVQDLKFSDQGCSFSTRLMLAPVFSLPDYKDVTVAIPRPTDADQATDEFLKNLQDRHTDFHDVLDRPAALGDILVCDYSSTIDGIPLNDALGADFRYFAGQQDAWIRLEEDAFIPDFVQAVVGVSPGETREFTIRLPEDYGVTALAGKELLYNAQAKIIKQPVPPEIDDALAYRAFPGKTLEQLKEILHASHLQSEARRIDDLKVERIIETLLSRVDFELPEELVAQETQSQADSMVDAGVNQGMSNEEIAAHQEEIFSRARARAIYSLKSNFLLQEIAHAEGITVSDRDIRNHIARLAAANNSKPDKLLKDLVREHRISGIRSSLLVGKVFDFLIEHASFTEQNDSPTAAETATLATNTQPDA